jgi:cell division initiation protein
MSFTAEDIQTKQFNVRFRGFDIDEVDSFLEQVAENYSLLAHEYNELNNELEKMKNEIEECKSRETTFHHAILAAQKIADEIEAKSRREAEELVSNAQEEARRLNEEATTEIAALEKQLDQLKDAKKKIQEELKGYLTSCLQALERGEVPSLLTASEIEAEEEDFASDAFEPEGEKPEDDLKDLYEKIELPAEMDLAGIDTEESASGEIEEQEQDAFFGESQNREEAEGNGSAVLPDLDGDMMFTMNDPVELEDEPAVVIGGLKEDEKGS